MPAAVDGPRLHAGGTIGRSDFHEVMTRFATCVTVVTAYDAQRPVGCTATAVFSLTDRPPSMVVSLAAGSGTLRHIRAAGTFAINVLPWHRRELAHQFATSESDRRFEGVSHEERHGAPVLTEAVASVVCRLAQDVPLLDHSLIVGEVISAGVDGCADPLVLYRRQQRRPAI
jgi:flavin reductase (DIM6/NTAB) family NADH-FMN oxidoreductase RutF